MKYTWDLAVLFLLVSHASTTRKGPKVKPKNSAMWSLLITELMLELGKSL